MYHVGCFLGWLRSQIEKFHNEYVCRVCRVPSGQFLFQLLGVALAVKPSEKFMAKLIKTSRGNI